MKLYEIYETDNHLILILEFLGGGTLLDKIIKKKKLSEKKCAIILQKLVEALDYLHKLNILHRDIKLENIFCEN